LDSQIEVAALTDPAAGLPSLDGRVVVVTGAGAGSGRAGSELLARLGAAVGVLDVDADSAAMTVKAIEAAGGRAVALVADVADRTAVEAAAALASQRLGACDGLVNYAEVAPEAPLEDVGLDDWDRATAVNLGGAFTCMQVFGGAMLERGSGSVVNVCPVADPAAGAVVAATAGAGLRMLARLGAVEWGNRGVRVNSVEVGPAAGPPAVAAAVAFLVGDGSSYVTGESFEVNEEV
jgi:NAD(P)-dependent dehydrogenase (short-subunit alcohol dehydrogenase family)